MSVHKVTSQKTGGIIIHCAAAGICERTNCNISTAWNLEHWCCCVFFFPFCCWKCCFSVGSHVFSWARPRQAVPAHSVLCQSGPVFNAILHCQTNCHSLSLYSPRPHSIFLSAFPSVLKWVLTQWCNLVQFHLFEGPAEALVSETLKGGAFLWRCWLLCEGHICLHTVFLYVCRLHLGNTI